MKRRIIIIIVAIFLLFVLAELIIDANWIEVTNYTITSEKIPKSFEGYKILQISDLHGKEFGEKNKYLIRKIDEIVPDIIVITGDMVTATDENFDTFYELIEQIKEKYTIYFVPGNHEYALTALQKSDMKLKIQEFGIDYLDNERVQITKNGDVINLYGLWYENKFYFKRKPFVLSRTLVEEYIGERDIFSYNILLTHNPGYIDVYSFWGADLILSGHIHGGMVRLPFIGAIFSSDEGLFPKYSAGLYEMDGSKLIISRGLGRGSRGFRLFNRPELVVVTLKST